MLQVGKPIFFPIFLPLATIPSIDQFLPRYKLACLNFPNSKKFLIRVEEIIFRSFNNGEGLIIL